MRLGSCGVLAALNHPGGQRLEVFWVVTEEGVQVASSRRGRDAAGHPLLHRTGPPPPPLQTAEWTPGSAVLRGGGPASVELVAGLSKVSNHWSF